MILGWISTYDSYNLATDTTATDTFQNAGFYGSTDGFDCPQSLPLTAPHVTAADSPLPLQHSPQHSPVQLEYDSHQDRAYDRHPSVPHPSSCARIDLSYSQDQRVRILSRACDVRR
jgi:hypothetical protein